MAEHNETGKIGEDAAAEFLERQGFVILERNWRYRHLELDLVAKKEELLIICEVKTRATDRFGPPEVFLSRPQQRRIVRAAHQYVVLAGLDVEVRFDVLAITGQGEARKINHIQDAFYAGN